MIHSIKIKRCKGGWYFRLTARNGRTLCHSEVYKSLAGCRKTAVGIREMLYAVEIEEE